MKSPGHIQVDDELLAKYLSGEASPEEAMAVDDWADASGSNRAVFDQAARLWAQTSNGNTWQLPDKLAVLAAIRKTQKPVKIASVNLRRWSVAAAVLLLLAAAGFYQLLHKTAAPAVLQWVTRQADNAELRDTLPDGSLITLSNPAAIRYVAGFDGNTRTVYLTGNGHFDVTSDPGKPFIVDAGDITIKVLGTAFDVRQDSSVITVAVASGAVSMYRDSSNLTVKAGETGIYDRRLQQFRMAVTDSIAQPGGKSFNFTNASLKSIAAELEKAYGIKVVFKNKRLETCTMSSTFDNKSVEFIFEVISITLNVQYRIEKDTVYISGSGCN